MTEIADLKCVLSPLNRSSETALGSTTSAFQPQMQDFVAFTESTEATIDPEDEEQCCDLVIS